MLTYMRTRSKKWVKWIIFGAIIIVFVFWGGSSYLTKETNKIAKIDRYIVTQQQYAKAYEDTLRMYQNQLGNALTPEMVKQLDLKNKVLDQIIDEYVLNYEAKKLGITVSDEELQSAIRRFPPFQENGQFSPENYRRLLAYQRLTPAQFEDMQRKEVLKQRIYTLIAENVVVSPTEIASLFKYQNDTFNLGYVAIDTQAYVSGINVTDPEAAVFYDANKEKYKIPPKITLTCILFPSVNYTKDVTVTADDAKGYYDSHKDEFNQKPKVRGRHILISVPQGADAAVASQKKELAQKVYDQVKAGGDFAALAKQYSEDAATKSGGGDFGLVPTDSLPKEMAEAFSKMKTGEVSAPVKTNLGFHMLKLEAREEGKSVTLEEATPSIMEKMKLERAKIFAGDVANKSYQDLYEQGKTDLAAYARSHGLPVKQIGPFAEGESIGIPNAARIVKNAFLYPKGELGSVVDTDDGYMIYSVTDKISSRIPELSEVKDRVIADVKRSKSLEKAKAYAARLQKNRTELEAAARLSTGDFKRTAYVIPELGMIPGVKNDLDKLDSPRTYIQGGKVYVVWVQKKQEADMKGADQNQLRKIRDELLSRKREMAVETFLQEARKSHDITIEKEKLQ